MKRILFYALFLNLVLFQQSVISQSVNNYSELRASVIKKTERTKDQKSNWQHLDFDQDTIAGTSIDKAYQYASRHLKVKDTIVVAVIDSDPDLNHEELQGQIWVNPKEIANNNIDDDSNGYVDDIHGWNFVSSAEGESMIFSLLEETRIIQKYKNQFSTLPLQLNTKDSANYKKYVAAKVSYDITLAEVNTEIERLKEQKKTKKEYENAVKILFPNSELNTIKGLSDINTEDYAIIKKLGYLIKLKKKNITDASIDADIEQNQTSIDICFNLEKDNRAIIVKDNPNDITDTRYGSPKFSSGIDHLVHSTSVSGVIAANRTNTIGVKGVAQHAKIMFLNIASFGDHTDKDLALSIRYAVDNGACIINISQSKNFSMHQDWVDDALKYAQDHNVLIITSAGNSNLDLDIAENLRYPNDIDNIGNEIVDNYITVGASSYYASKKIKQTASNYGRNSVDLFAPGRSIKVIRPYNKYVTRSGTSHAAPIVSGIAAMVLSYYPDLSARQLKEILLTSGIGFDVDATIKDSKETIPFSQLSKSGKVVNAYNALLMAEKMSSTKK